MKSSNRDNFYQALKTYWGYTDFRKNQLEIVESIWEGRDTLAILPTGGGKSLCYQLPAILLPEVTLVVSPLLALMQDQVESLLSKGVAAAMINSTQSRQENDAVLESLSNGGVQLLYCAPERLVQEHFLEVIQDVSIGMIVIDEAHCISQWGHDFRPSYRKIVDFLASKPVARKMALTASATKAVERDIIEQLSMEHPQIFRESIYRQNIAYKLIETEDKWVNVQKICTAAPFTSIVYCPTRISTEKTAHWLRQHRIDAIPYHAGMAASDRADIQHKWMQSDTKVICATNAFGMGIDKPNVRTVVHLTPPFSIEAYYQEAGRAGRDGLPSEAVLLWCTDDVTRLEESIALQYPHESFLYQVYEAVFNYLQIAVGEGEDTIQFIDIPTLTQAYKLPIIPTLSAIKLLALSDIWVWQQDDRTEHKATFVCGRDDLDNLENYDPECHAIAIGLLRIYGDIFHYLVRINPFHDGKIIGMNYEQMINGLVKLDNLGIIKYFPAQEGSSLYLLQDRLPISFLRLDKEKISFLKKNYEEKVKEIIKFVTNNKGCRSQSIAHYFGEEESKECGICDVCQVKNATKHKKENTILIRSFLKEKNNIAIDEVLTHFANIGKENIWDILTTFAHEAIISIDNKMIQYHK